MNALSPWLDKSAIGRAIKHDPRFEYNPPAPAAPAMSDEQFEYDNQRQINEAVLTNPTMLAHVIMNLRERIELLEGIIDDNRSNR